MPFTICLNTSTIRPQPLLEKIRLTAEAGFRGVELWLNDVYEYIGRGGEVRDVEKAVADRGLIVPCTIAMRAWAEASEEEYPILLDEARRRLELAQRLGSPYLVCSPPREACNPEQITRRYRDLLELGRQIGCRPTYEYISFFRSTASLAQAWQIVCDADDPDATIILDAFHTWNTSSPQELMREIPVERISHYHIDDADPGIPPGRQRDPDRVMVGDGCIDLRREFRILHEIGYQGTVSLELFNPSLWQQDPAEVLKLGYERIQALLSEIE